eukprot:TRINITY_DN46091_c0_g1_i1.p1 TRINITY_DN46091_c0_g1~~TRINITY_DN46091_c0_g1_i1.p1  ORF type:complete len:310 (+),score=69.76 TRINITY_DN46091_c0_g1_i1:141-1070(+)
MDYGAGPDYGWGAAADGAPAGGAPPAGGPPPGAGGPPPGGPPQAAIPDPQSMSVKELKAELMNLGVDFTDCYEKSELVARLTEVQEKQRNVLTIDARTTAEASAVVIFLHGLGDQAAPWLGPLQSVAQRLPHVRFVVPNAPMLHVQVNEGRAMPAWYDVIGLNAEAAEHEETINISEKFVAELVRDETKRGVKPERIVLGGFSQGGAAALNALVKHSTRLAGGFALSGWVPLRAQVAANASPANHATPVRFFHGAKDTVVAPAWAEASAEALKPTHANTEIKVYPELAHQSHAAEMSDLAEWLMKVIPQ